MVAQLLRLRLAQFVSALRGGHRGGLVVIALLVFALTGAAFVLLVTLRTGSVETARIAVIALGTLLTLVSLLLPFVLGTESEFDPRRYLVFGVRRTPLAAGLLLGSLMSLVGLALIVLAIGQVVTWSSAAAPYAIAAGVVIVLGYRLLSLVIGALASSGIDSRRASQGGLLGALALVVMLVPIVPQLIADTRLDGLGWLDSLADGLSWTPFAIAWAAPADAAVGDTGLATTRIVIGSGYVLVLALAWFWIVARAELRPRRGATERFIAGLGWFTALAGSPAGAVAARSLHYWGRDIRYRASLLTVPVVPALVVGVLAVAGVEARLLPLIALPIACLFLGWSTVHNDLALDNTAFWMHVSAGLRGVHDRLGRVVPALLLGIPLILVLAPVTAWVAGSWEALPGIIGVCVGALCGALGIGSVASALAPYPAVHPGDRVSAQPQTAATGAGMTQFLTVTGPILVAGPAITGLVLSGLTQTGWSLFALFAGVVLGVAVLVTGIRYGGRLVDVRAPELLAFTQRF